MSCYWQTEFVNDDGMKLVVDCVLASEGRGMGIYVSEVESAVFYKSVGDNSAPQFKLTSDEMCRLSEQVCEDENALRQWEDRDYGYDY